MCLILFDYKKHPKYTLIVASNRDEFYDRPTKPAAPNNKNPNIICGMDLLAGGTWTGVNQNGKFVALTNYREFPLIQENKRSRGMIAFEFLNNDTDAFSFLEQLNESKENYNGFNVLISDETGLFHYSNREGKINHLAPDTYGLSNALLDTPWPKVKKGKSKFESIVAKEELEIEDIFRMLQDKELADDKDLPDTGVGLEKERMLSPLFIESPNYGTRLSTIITFDYQGNIFFEERTYKPEKIIKKYSFKIKN